MICRHRIYRRAPRLQGLTILEMLVSSAMLALIVFGLTAMLIQTQRAFKTGVKQPEVGDVGRSVSELITSDLEQLSDGQPFAANFVNNGVTNLMWGWNTDYPITENGVAFRTNQLQSIYMLVHTNTGWMGIGYIVSNLAPGLGVGTLYRSLSPVNAHYINNDATYGPFTNILNGVPFQLTNLNPNFRLSRIADGIVHLKMRVYDTAGDQVGGEVNYGDFCPTLTNSFPMVYPTNFLPAIYVTNDLPGSVEFELGILEPDSWEHLKGLGNFTAQANYLSSSSAKVDIFRQQILIHAAIPQ